MSNTITGQPYFEFYNLLPSERDEAARQLFSASLEVDPAYKIELVQPEEQRFYFIVSERGKGGEFVETSRNPSDWAAAVAVAGAWDQQKPEHERPNAFDIESMGAHFELIALHHFVDQNAEESRQM